LGRSGVAGVLATLWEFENRTDGTAAMHGRIHTFCDAALNLVFPPSCFACGHELTPGSSRAQTLFCAECLEQLQIYQPPFCFRCGCGQVGSSGFCPHCLGAKLDFDRAIALGHYSGHFRDIVLRMKKSAGESLALATGELMWVYCRDRLLETEPDFITPVPMHWLRRTRRGTNSAAILAEVLGRRLHVPVWSGVLRRHRNTLPQSGLSRRQRVRNLSGALALGVGYGLQGTRVLLVDDIMTTGSTCNAATRLLKAAGVVHVTVVSVVRSPAA
jgi:ComF family protein